MTGGAHVAVAARFDESSLKDERMTRDFAYNIYDIIYDKDIVNLIIHFRIGMKRSTRLKMFRQDSGATQPIQH